MFHHRRRRKESPVVVAEKLRGEGEERKTEWDFAWIIGGCIGVWRDGNWPTGVERRRKTTSKMQRTLRFLGDVSNKARRGFVVYVRVWEAPETKIKSKIGGPDEHAEGGYRDEVTQRRESGNRD